MPIDFEMLLSASPPLYAYSAFLDRQYTCFTSSECNQFSEGYLRHHSSRSHLQCSKPYNCLDSGNESNCQKDDINSVSKTFPCDCIDEDQKLRVKKHVSFADDKGLDLVEVRSIPVVTHATPKWTRSFLSFVTGSIEPHEENVCEKQWTISFTNPADPLEQCQRVETNGLALYSITDVEGAITDTVEGKIAVKKSSQERKVFVRVTFDRWVTHEDIPAKYSIADNKDNMRDIFQFSASIPSSAFRYEVIEFCFCCEVEGIEYWDNNGGINYRLVTTTGKNCTTTTQVSQILSNNQKKSSEFEQLSKQLGSPSDIDVWKSFLNEHPYW